MTMMTGGGSGRAMDATVKPLVQSVKTGKIFVVLKSADDLVSGERYVFFARPRHLNDMRRITRQRFEELFRAFAEPPPAVSDPRIATTQEDVYAALDQEMPERPTGPVQVRTPEERAQAEAAAQAQTPAGTEQAPKKRRGRPKGSKNKKTLEREAALAAQSQPQKTPEQIAQEAGLLPKDNNQSQTEQETADATTNARAL